MYMEQMLNDKVSLNVQIPLKLWPGWQDEIFESHCEEFFFNDSQVQQLKKDPK